MIRPNTVRRRLFALLLLSLALQTCCTFDAAQRREEFNRGQAAMDPSDVAGRAQLAEWAASSRLWWEAVGAFEALSRETGRDDFARRAAELARRLPPSPVPDSDKVLVLAVAGVRDSMDTARLYAYLRGIPTERILALDCPAQEEITRQTFNDTVARPVKDALTRIADAQYVVACFGVPLKVRDDVWLRKQQYARDGAALDAEIALVRVDDFESFGPYANPLCLWRDWGLPAKVVPAGTRILKVGRLDGPTAAAAQMLAVRAVLAERAGVTGAAYLDVDPDVGRRAAFLNAFLYRSAEELAASDRVSEVVVESTHALFAGPCRNVLLYEGWYGREPTAGVFQWSLGAIGYHIYSFSASTLATGPGKDSWCSLMVREGVTATVGHVYEPYAGAVFRGWLLWKNLLAGRTLGEAALRATPLLSWMNVVVGDPLYRPFGGSQIERFPAGHAGETFPTDK